MAGTDVTRRTLLAGMAAAPFAGGAAAQSAWPDRPVRVMVPYPPAGGADTTARILFTKLGADLGQQFVIENRGGAGGTIGEAMVARAPADGYTLLHDATAFSVNSSLYPDLTFDYRKDFDPVFLASLVPNILVVNKEVPAKTVADVIALAKAAPDGLDFACAFNHEVDDPAKGALVSQINAVLNRHLVVHPGGVVASISRFIIRLVDRVLRVVGLRLDP